MSLIELNDLVYGESTDASVNIQRHLRKFYPRKNTFTTREKIQIKIQGEQFVDMKNSSLRFQVRLIGAGVLELESGSIINFINRVRIMSSSGEEISDVRRVNLLQRFHRVLHQSINYNFISQSWGTRIAPSSNQLTAGTLYEFVVPMRLISPFWDNEQLLPPMIARDLTLELYLEALPQLGNISANITGYEIYDPYLIVDCVLATPDITQAINSLTGSGMIYEYCDYVHSETNTETANVDFVFEHSLSNALEALVVPRLSSVVNQNGTDPFQTTNMEFNPASPNYRENQVVFRIGDLQLPQDRAVGAREIYNTILHARGQLESAKADDFQLTFSEFVDTYGCYFVNLRRSKLFENSGREISNQRNLVCQFRRDFAGVYINDFFVKYIGRINISNDIIDVER